MVAEKEGQHESKSLPQILGGRDLLVPEFIKWMAPILKGRGQMRAQSGILQLNEMLNYGPHQLIELLEGFAGRPIACGLAHEMGDQVIQIMDGRIEKLNQRNCILKFSNSGCGHPELSGLAQAIFFSERLISNRQQYSEGIRLIEKITELDELVGSLPNSGRTRKTQIITEQSNISQDIHDYILKLLQKLKELYLS